MLKEIKKTIRNKVNAYVHHKNLRDTTNYKIVVLLYHQIKPEYNKNYFNTSMCLETFKKQIIYFKKNFYICSNINEIFNSNIQEKIRVVITFDDACIDNYLYAFPFLKEIGLKAFFSLPTKYIEYQKPLWDYEIIEILNNYEGNIKFKEKKENIFFDRSKIGKKNFQINLINYLKYKTFTERENLINQIRDQVDYSKFDFSSIKCMNWKHVIEMSNHGMIFGSHGSTHTSLRFLNEIDIYDELNDSKEIIRTYLKKECEYIAFQFGSLADYNNQIIDITKKNNYQFCFLNIQGFNILSNDLFSFKRVFMSEHHQYKNFLY